MEGVIRTASTLVEAFTALAILVTGLIQTDVLAQVSIQCIQDVYCIIFIMTHSTLHCFVCRY